MWYKMIENKRNIWLSESACPISSLIDYIEKKGEMRDAQIEAIKTYLFLKIYCENKPLASLFSNGTFNTINIYDLEVKYEVRNFLSENPAALALFEYASTENEAGVVLSQKTIDAIKECPDSINYSEVLNDVFYGVSYTDYLFSLPMGAGKTFLMAAFIYLDLYYAQNEPDNPVFAHNFIVFAPSGLKTSIVPSLKTIQKFDPSWVIPEPAAANIKRLLKFELLDQNKSAKKSNKTKNPNVQKINLYQPLHELMGLVTVTNAEKVILDRIELIDGQFNFLEDSEDQKDRYANELRNLIGKLPNLSIFIDEVHHAPSKSKKDNKPDSNEESKLRAVVNRWIETGTINSVIGFSGTPYIEKNEKINIKDGLALTDKRISMDELPLDNRDRLKAIYDKHKKDNRSYNFMSFNYTNTFDKILERTKRNTQQYQFSHISEGSVRVADTCGVPLHVHGTLGKGMILGLNDVLQIDNEILRNNNQLLDNIIKPFLNKEGGTGNLLRGEKMLIESTIICIYGMSIGETDKMWWELIGKAMKQNSELEVVIFKHNDEYNASLQSTINVMRNEVRSNFMKRIGIDSELEESIEGRVHVVMNHDIFSNKIVDKNGKN